MEDKVRVVIAEDSVLLRDGLTRLLTDRGHDVVAGVGDAVGLIKAVDELASQGAAPDVVVADVRMPPPTRTKASARRCSCAGSTPRWASWCCLSMWKSSTRPS